MKKPRESPARPRPVRGRRRGNELSDLYANPDKSEISMPLHPQKRVINPEFYVCFFDIRSWYRHVAQHRFCLSSIQVEMVPFVSVGPHVIGRITVRIFEMINAAIDAVNMQTEISSIGEVEWC